MPPARPMILNAVGRLDQDVVELILLIDERLLDPFEIADGALQQRAVVGKQIGDRARRVADVGDRACDRILAVLQPGDEFLEILQGVVELLLMLDGGVQHRVQVA